MPIMTKQEIFNKVVEVMASQKFERSMSGHHCAYRGEAGMKCAAGALIKDEFYNKKFEGASVFSEIPPSIGPLKAKTIALDEAMANSGIPKEELQFVGDLQIAHDSGHRPELMRGYLLKIAENHALTIPDSLKVVQ